jgi:hypothetical protein
VGDIDEEGAAGAAWEAAREILEKDDLEAEDFDTSALVVLTEADRLLASLSDEESRERRAQVLRSRTGSSPTTTPLSSSTPRCATPGSARAS